MNGHKDAFTNALTSNKDWASSVSKSHPDLLPTLAKGQSPAILWLGCSDSRVPETTLLGLQPGDVFVHRNIANILHASDMSSLAVVEFAVGVLKVSHIVLSGHTGCGGVKAALGSASVGSVLDGWLMPVRRLRAQFAGKLKGMGSQGECEDFLIRENVKQGVKSLREMGVVGKAIRERGLVVHGVVYNVGTGLLEVVDGCDEPEEEKNGREGVFKVM
ncbi:hypothetical protein MMC10_002505 [Thelotrema lepadinum]|nr:hypothetical protein [Thelotrema lepadinum]